MRSGAQRSPGPVLPPRRRDDDRSPASPHACSVQRAADLAPDPTGRRSGHAEAVPAMGGGPLPERQDPLALSGRRRRGARAALRRADRAARAFLWAITLRDGDDTLIGLMDLRPDDGVSREQRGFWIDPEFWGQGLMTEAAELVTEYA